MKNIYFQTILFFVLSFFLSLSSNAQNFNEIDKSPHDIVYFRANKISPPVIKVLYGRPQKKGRDIFGSLIPYNKVWRVGANEATEIRFYKDVIFGEKKVKAGTYVLFAIPGEKEWTLILSSSIDAWGAFKYKKQFDVARVKAKVSKSEPIEIFSIGFKSKGKRVDMVLAWDTTRVKVPIIIVKE
ncbi:MAG: DUF2911 domain-containing protein [Flavobacteriaceae bacterium]|nr:DUF2911 domain-containing protein [Flavobacteriaceae bacterium]